MSKKRKKLVVGILKEQNKSEKRAPLTPSDIKWLVERGIKVEVEANPLRIFSDNEYRKVAAEVVKSFKKANFLVGIKAMEPSKIVGGKIYMVFSHTVKGQKNNIPLLKEFLRKNVTLIDYENVRDGKGRRLVYFGRFAGICGMVDSLHYYGLKLKGQGIVTPFLSLKQSWKYKDIDDMRNGVEKVREKIKNEGLPGKIAPFIVGVIGRGNVSGGAQEILGLMGAEEVHPRDMNRFVKKKAHLDRKKIYMIVFYREEKIRSKTGKKFYFEEYREHPELFESNMDKYIPKLNMLINASYWDENYPRIVTKKMIKDLYGKKRFRLGFIGDISCDVGGGIEITHKATTQRFPVYTYDPLDDAYRTGYRSSGITILAIDNLPTELPRDSSENFSKLIREYVYQVAEHGSMDITEHVALPKEMRRAVVTQAGKLTDHHEYLYRHFTQ